MPSHRTAGKASLQPLEGQTGRWGTGKAAKRPLAEPIRKTGACRVYEELHEVAPRIAERAAKVAEALPEETLEGYARLIKFLFFKRRRSMGLLEIFLDPREVDKIRKMLLNPLSTDSKHGTYENIGGILIPDSSILNEEELDGRKAVITELIHEYGYYERELRLLRQHSDEIISMLSPDKTIGMVALGAGRDKLEEVLRAFTRQRRNLDTLFLIDSNSIALLEAHEHARSLYRGPNAAWRFAFEQFAESTYFAGMMAKTAGEWFTINLGTTFCNLPAEINFGLLEAVVSDFALIGIYLLKDDLSNVPEILGSYSGRKMREQAKKGAMLLGVREEDLDSKTAYRPRFVSVDLSGTHGPGFERVQYLVAGFDVNERIETEFGKVYEPGETIGGFYSIKYSDCQFRALCSLRGYGIPFTANDDEVRLYLLQKHNPSGTG